MRKVIDPSYISGFVDGEGSFVISFSPRKKMSLGWEIRPSFSVSQRRDRAEVLFLIKEYFDCGSIREDKSDGTLKYEVRSLNDLVWKVLPHFKKFPLLSSKRKDLAKFMTVCEMMKQGIHLTPEGFKEIAKEATSMNPGGKRRYLPHKVKI